MLLVIMFITLFVFSADFVMAYLYTKASQTERDNAYEILSSLYPTENDRTNKIKTGTNK